MAIGPDTVKHIAHLARLAIDEEAVRHYDSELSAILELVERMNAVDTAGIEPLAHPLDMVQRLRDDEATEPDVRERVQAQAPAVEDGLYLVPRVLE